MKTAPRVGVGGTLDGYGSQLNFELPVLSGIDHLRATPYCRNYFSRRRYCDDPWRCNGCGLCRLNFQYFGPIYFREKRSRESMSRLDEVLPLASTRGLHLPPHKRRRTTEKLMMSSQRLESSTLRISPLLPNALRGPDSTTSNSVSMIPRKPKRKKKQPPSGHKEAVRPGPGACLSSFFIAQAQEKKLLSKTIPPVLSQSKRYLLRTIHSHEAQSVFLPEILFSLRQRRVADGSVVRVTDIDVHCVKSKVWLKPPGTYADWIFRFAPKEAGRATSSEMEYCLVVTYHGSLMLQTRWFGVSTGESSEEIQVWSNLRKRKILEEIVKMTRSN